MTKRQWKRLPQPTEDELWDLFQYLMESIERGKPPEWTRQHRATCLKILPWSRKLIRRARWFYVRQAIDRGMVPKSAYHYAANLLKGTPAECSPDMMKKDYNAVEKTIG